MIHSGLVVLALASPLWASDAPLMAQAPAIYDWGRLNRFFDRAAARPALPAGAVRGTERASSISPLPFSGALKSARPVLVVPAPQPDHPHRRLFQRMLRQTAAIDRYDEALLAEARRHGLDPRLLKSVMAAESEFNPRARSPRGALGLMQILPATAESVGVPAALLRDPWHNVRAGAAYIARLYESAARRYRLKGVAMADAPVWVVQRVIAAYHAGPRFLARTDWYRSTRQYVRKVLLFYQSRVTDVRR